ncbi:metallophosphoesterase family protein [Mucilaginibacter lacusdianchii]|uniref:metallophosphoesterase family protein n=1 Tax=Mucilaginibacter lacusdianchii TaxID=2684211 RepID=UPI00131B179C|nr:YfcE family phosphodiesterase [Mucilaginibacter sp. JXJ CY 39]
MRIALFSDVHANLPAFEAFLANLDQQKVDAVYCLGDLIGYHIWPNEVINEVRRRGIAMLAGNHDLKVKGYAYELISDDNRAYLNTLPAHVRLEYQLNSDHLNIVLAHGSPRSINEYVIEDLDEDYVLGMMEEANADILCVGHSHIPYHRVLGGKQVINTGSVGKPKDSNPDGCYVILTLGEKSVVTEPGSVGIEIVRFPYDVERAARAIEDSPLPNELAEQLRKAF